MPSVPTWDVIHRSFDQILEDLSHHVHTRWIFIAATTPTTFTVVRQHFQGIAQIGLKPATIPLRDVYCQWVVEDKTPLILPDAKASPFSHKVAESRVGAYLGVPITTSSGEIYGTLCATHDEPYPYSDTEILLITQAARMTGLVLDMEQLAVRDPLTGVYNRGFFEHHLQYGAVPLTDRWGIIIIDFDGFKNLNDQWGHDIGDIVLREMSQRINRAIPDSGSLVRLGGDEFLAVIPGLPHGNETLSLTKAANAMHKAFAQPIHVSGQTLSASISMGLAWSPRHGSTMPEVFHNADQALYQAKSAGKARIHMA